MSDGELQYQESQTPVLELLETLMGELQAYLQALDQRCEILSHNGRFTTHSYAARALYQVDTDERFAKCVEHFCAGIFQQ